MYSKDFLTFWAHYPNKRKKALAAAKWEAMKPPLERCLATLAWMTRTAAWLEEDGRYVPHAATWIFQSQWEDEPPAPVEGGGAPVPSARERANAAVAARFVARHARKPDGGR